MDELIRNWLNHKQVENRTRAGKKGFLLFEEVHQRKHTKCSTTSTSAYKNKDCKQSKTQWQLYSGLFCQVVYNTIKSVFGVNKEASAAVGKHKTSQFWIKHMASDLLNRDRLLNLTILRSKEIWWIACNLPVVSGGFLLLSEQFDIYTVSFLHSTLYI